MHYIFLLGADDPEMKAMAQLLIVFGAPFLYSSVEGGRTTPGNSYRADPIDVPDAQQLVVVECAFEDMPGSTIVIDHHRPGDPGFALGPDQFWEASSIGQLHALLGIEPDHDALVMAAFDHCFATAVRGGCTGVTAEEVIHLRIGEIAKQTRTSGDAVWKCVTGFRSAFTRAPDIMIGKQPVKDMRGEHLGVGYSLEYLSAQLAVVMNGGVALFRHKDHKRQAEKNTLTGHATPATVKFFMEKWAVAQGLVRVFGVPERGYAGGFVPRRRISSARTA